MAWFKLVTLFLPAVTWGYLKGPKAAVRSVPPRYAQALSHSGAALSRCNIIQGLFQGKQGSPQVSPAVGRVEAAWAHTLEEHMTAGAALLTAVPQ